MTISPNHRHDHPHSHGHEPLDHNHDGHHLGPPVDDVELSRRHLLYFLTAGVFATTGLSAFDGAAAAVKKRAGTGTRKPTSKKGSSPPSTVVPASTTIAGTTPPSTGTGTAPATTANAADPWSLFPNTVKATRATTGLQVESTGLPEHQMMVGITSWQQQFPFPQPYTGTNSWHIPLQGVLSDSPVSGKTALFRGAIALAINGVPIFNALNNRGDDAFLSGELDTWGGHCGRADDYHYHMAPLHLQKAGTAATPIAYALDGFVIYGLTEPDGSAVSGLDAYNGHTHGTLGYHYHATLTFPYVNGGMRGKVSVVGDQVDPQPVLRPFRPAGEPLRGAQITAFAKAGSNAYSLSYKLNGETYRVDYALAGTTATFIYVAPNGTTRSETFPRA